MSQTTELRMVRKNRAGVNADGPPTRSMTGNPTDLDTLTEGKTKHVRVKQDLMDMIVWIAYFKTLRVAEYLDVVMRAQIESDYAQYSHLVAEFKKMRAGATKKTKKSKE